MTLAHVAGHATVEVDPDEAHLSLRVLVDSDTGAEEAYRRFAVASARARALLDRDGVEHWADSPESWSERQDDTLRYRCGGRIRAKITGLDQIGSLPRTALPTLRSTCMGCGGTSPRDAT